MTYVEVPINVCAQFELERLCIVAELVAATHQFVFNDKAVTVHLPGPEKPSVSFDIHNLRVISRRSADKVPLKYSVRTVTLEMALPEPIHVPDELLRLPPKQYKLVQPDENERLDQTVREAGEELRAAFAHWLAIVRWKSGIGYIGEPSISYGGDGQSAALCERATGHRLWTETVRIAVQLDRAVTEADWAATQSALVAGKTAPVWFDFLFDSEMRLNNKDLVGAVLSLAIALETNIRYIFFGELSKATVDPVIVEILDLTNVRALLSRLKKTERWTEEWASATDVSTFHRLMDLRNNVMHLAITNDVDAQELRKMHKAVTTFAYFTSDALGLS
ncbi:hypothetical protein [Bradyrhizobium sp. MOS002]|uniref:hypothetical protein n=1 Tax=Bradyrhizobium sp. MOS002 TaxID=2133947 RepID=UPI000D11F829|nr:hypothetical protein [Bradyrhizobium sp. MOS002]PSO17615.1 hypothetical protein C7G41_36050 [Bradyrhizobium sp. MOS002]